MSKKIKIKGKDTQFVYPLIFAGKGPGSVAPCGVDSSRVFVGSVPSADYDMYFPFKDTVLTGMKARTNLRYKPMTASMTLLAPDDTLLPVLLKSFGIPYLRIVQCGSESDSTQTTYGKKYVLKAAYAARSLGKAIVDRKLLKEMLEFVENNKGASVESAGKLFNEKFGNPSGKIWINKENYKLYESLVDNNAYLQEYVDIEEEYRYYYFNTPVKGSKFVYRRFGCRLDISEDEDTYRVPKKKVPATLLKSLNAMARYYKVPWMSVDIYKDTSGNWGVFEIDYNYQFGDIPELVRDIGDLSTDALVNTIREVNPFAAKVADMVEGR